MSTNCCHWHRSIRLEVVSVCVCVCVLVIDMNKYYKTRPACAGLVDDGYFQNYSTGREM